MNGAEHRETRLFGALLTADDQTLVKERLHAVQHIDTGIWCGFAYPLRSLQSEAAHENREPAEEPLLVLVQQHVAPFDRGSQGLLPSRQIPGPARQEEKRIPFQALEHGAGRENVDTCGGELDRERNPLQAPTDLADSPAEPLGSSRARSSQMRWPSSSGFDRLSCRHPLGRELIERQAHEDAP